MKYYQKQVRKWGSSYLIPLPMQMVKELKIKVNDKVELKWDGTFILVKRIMESGVNGE